MEQTTKVQSRSQGEERSRLEWQKSGTVNARPTPSCPADGSTFETKTSVFWAFSLV